MSLACLSSSDVETLCVMRAESLFVDKNSGLIHPSYTPLPPEIQ